MADEIQFIVEYEDGSTAHMSISRWLIRTGDHVVLTIAGERQRAGTLPPGNIKNVRRGSTGRS